MIKYIITIVVLSLLLIACVDPYSNRTVGVNQKDTITIIKTKTDTVLYDPYVTTTFSVMTDLNGCIDVTRCELPNNVNIGLPNWVEIRGCLKLKTRRGEKLVIGFYDSLSIRHKDVYYTYNDTTLYYKRVQ